MRLWRNVVLEVLISVLSSAVIQISVVAAPLVLTALAFIGQIIPLTWPVTTLAAGWSTTLASLFLWFRNHQRHRAEMTREIIKMLSVANYALMPSIHPNLTPQDKEIMLKSLITQLLTTMCSAIAYRVNPLEKGASLLIPTGRSKDAHFRLFAKHGLDNPLIENVVYTELLRENSLAGQALDEGKCLVIRDCRHPPPNMRWRATQVQPEYRGRAAAPVFIFTNNQLVEIGALCFDVRRPHKLDDEDQDLLQLCAEKITYLWRVLGPDPNTTP